MPIAVWDGSPIDKPIQPSLSPKADWRWAFGHWNALPSNELPNVTGRSFTARVAGNSEAGFTIDGMRPEAAGIEEVDSDLWVFRNAQALYRGGVAASSITADQQSQSCVFSSADYRALLVRRLLFEGDTLVYSGLDQSQISWDLIAQAQAELGGQMNIIRGQGQTTGVIPPTQTYAAGSSVADAINQFTGFEWDVTPGFRLPMTFDVFYPLRGQDRSKIVDYPGQINTYTRTADPGTWANALRVTGNTGLAPVTVTAPTLGLDGDRRLDAQYGDPSLLTLSAVNAAAAKQLATQSTLLPSWVVTLAPNIWGGPNDVWIGDPVTLSIQHGMLNVLETLRVQELTVTFDDNSDAATVSLTLGAVPPQRRWMDRVFDKRLSALERR